MNRKNLSVLFGTIAVILILVSLPILGCSSQPAATPSPKPTTPSPTPAATPSPKPTTPSPTQPTLAPVDYKGRVITLVVGFAAGGGTDLWARLVARHIGKYLPGNPAVIVRNLEGGASTRAANYISSEVKPDGVIVSVSSMSTVLNNLLRTSGIKAELKDFVAVASAPIGQVLVVRSGILTDAKDLMKPEIADRLIFGCNDVTAGGANFVLPKKLLGFKVGKEVWGYTSAAEYVRAFLAGEVNFTPVSTLQYNTEVIQYVKKGDVVPLYQVGILDVNGNEMPDPAGPKGIPTVSELYQKINNRAPSGIMWQAYIAGAVAPNTFGKSVLLPPKTPDNIAAVWRKAAAEMNKDQKYLEEANKMSPGAAPLFAGEGIQQTYNSGVSQPSEVVKWIKDYYTAEYGVKFN